MFATIESVEFVEDCDIVYDLTIEDNHNLYVAAANDNQNYILAHNCLDENLKSIRTKSSKAELHGESMRDRPWALDNLFARYGNDFYFKASFSKADRNEGFANVKLTKPVLRYGAMDTQAPFGIMKMQLKRARLMRLGNKPFIKKYKRLVTGLYNDAVHTASTMKQNGAPVNRDYIIHQFAEETSDIFKEQMRVQAQLYKMKQVKKANKRLLKARALPEEGLFAGTSVAVKNWDFDIYSQEHQQLLFFDVMKLKPVEYTEKGKPSIGKAFLKKYKDNPVVAKFAIITEAKKAHSYVKSYYQKLSEPDGQNHSRIHASYGFVGVNTGRSNSFDPSFQQVPTHGTYAKIVKECFASPDGQVTIKMDYKAHEVMVWSLISGDDRLANTFRRIFNLWVEYRENPNDPKFAPDEKGNTILDLNDVHRVNYSGFTGTPVEEVTPVQRQSSKGITFGVMFGKAVRSLARELGYTDEEMQEIFDRFFGEFENAERFLKWTVAHARKHNYTYNLFGFRRNLWGHLTGIKFLQSAMDRRAQNSPIQGMASQISFVAARLLCIRMDQLFEKNGMYGKPKWDKKLAKFTMDMPAFALNAMVHDSTEVRCSYELAPLVKQAMEYCASTAVMKYTKKMYGINWLVRPQVDFEVMDSGGKSYGYDFTKKAWNTAIKSAWKDQRKRGVKTLTKRDRRNGMKPTPAVKKMMKDFPLDLRKYKGVV